MTTNPMQKNLWPVPPILRIDRLLLENFRGFIRTEIEFDPYVTVIVARNGCGKTAVLDAIAVALGPFVATFDKATGKNFKPSDVRRIPHPDRAIKEMEPQFPLHLQATGLVGEGKTEWSRDLRTTKSRTTFGEASGLIDFGRRLQEEVRGSAAGNGQSPVLPIISYYGTGRLWDEKRRLIRRRKATRETSRTTGYMDCLDSSSHYKVFADWFERLCRSAYEERDNTNRLEKILMQLSAIRQAVDHVLAPSGWHGVIYKSAEAGIVAEHDQFGQLSIDWLSDGIRNMIALAADIAHRAVRLNAHLGENAAKQTPGIVLIDEVDMHLHPEWQQTVVSSLTEAFPSIQFVVTTHSPQVLTTVQKGNIRLLSEDGQVQTIPDDMGTYGSESSRVLQEVFDVHSRPQNIVTVAKLSRYLELVELRLDGSEEGIGLRSELEKALGSGDPDLKMADLRINQLKFFNRK